MGAVDRCAPAARPWISSSPLFNAPARPSRRIS